MYFIQEYKNYLVTPHIIEKTIFYDLNVNLDSIIDNIKIHYKVFYDIFDKKLSLSTNFFFYTYFSSVLKYKNISFNNFICYELTLSSVFLYKFNIFYYNFISYLYDSYHSFFFVQDKIHSNIIIQFKSLSNFPSSNLFFETTSLNSLLNIKFNTSIKNTFFYLKVYISHFFLNI
jgi:hypothetical protein